MIDGESVCSGQKIPSIFPLQIPHGRVYRRPQTFFRAQGAGQNTMVTDNVLARFSNAEIIDNNSKRLPECQVKFKQNQVLLHFN